MTVTIKWSYLSSLLFFVLILLVLISGVRSDGTGVIPGISYYGGEYSTDNIPRTLITGQETQVMVEFQNSGLTAWEYDVEKFGVQYSGDNSLINVDPLISPLQKGSRVHSGQRYQFPFLITAHTPGHVDLQFAVVKILPSGKTTPVSEITTIPVKISEGVVQIDDSGIIQVSGGDSHFPVTLDGTHVGFTPLTIPGISVGYHTITVDGNEGVMEQKVQVLPNSIIEITYSPEKSLIFIETKKSFLLDNPDPVLTLILSNFFIILGLVLTLTAIGVCAVVVMTGRLKRVKYVVSQIIPPSISKHGKRDVSIIKKRNLSKEEVKFDPIPGIFHQGEKKVLKVKVINKGLKDIIIDNLFIPPGEFRILIRDLMDDNPGDNATEIDFTFTGGDGIEKNRVVHFQYQILSKVPDLSWIFDKFYQKNGRIIAVIKIHNKNLFDLTADTMMIKAGEEERVELEMDDPEDNASSIFRKISLSFKEGSSLVIPVRIPYNKGISLYFSRQFTESLDWFKQRIEDGDTDPVLQRYKNLVEKKISDTYNKGAINTLVSDNNSKTAINIKKQSSSIDVTGSNKTVIPTFSGFPDSLLSLYQPVSLVSSDRMGTIYHAIKTSDKESVALRILNPGNVPISSVELQIQAWRSLKHQNILQIKYWGRDPVYFLEFDLPSGAIQKKRRVYTLADLKVPIPPSAAVRIVRGLAHGIAYTHRQGVRHYLLEPTVILLDKGLNPKISGFDTSVLIQSRIPDQCWIAAPEQSDPDNYGNPGKKTDIYQVGAIFYYLITGLMPSVNNPLAILPSDFKAQYSKFDTLVSNCMSPDKNQRYSEIDDLIQELDLLNVHYSQKQTRVSNSDA